jgi:glycosyltransferase involved in cell wall biosynthesis
MPDDASTMSPGARRQPSVSIVIATRGPAPLLPRVIDRLIAEPYEGTIEVVVVIDGAGEIAGVPSPPSLSGTLRRAVRTLRNTGAPGLHGARRAGRLVAQGEIVVFCDDDEEWAPGRLRRIVARRFVPGRSVEVPDHVNR